MDFTQWKEVWGPLIVAVVLASIGGFLGSMIRAVDAGLKFSWFIILLETAVSAFAGVTVMLLCSYMDMDIRLAGATTAVCGWFGGRTTMLWLERRVKRTIQGSDK